MEEEGWEEAPGGRAAGSRLTAGWRGCSSQEETGYKSRKARQQRR